MRRTPSVRRAGRLLGAAVATGVLSTVLLGAGPLATDAGAATNANGVRVAVQADLFAAVTQDRANGV